MYLLPIFSSKDIVAQLPEEEVLFFQVDRIFRSAMNGVAKDPRVRETAGSVSIIGLWHQRILNKITFIYIGGSSGNHAGS